jgi:diaminobutyrate-2-oxoglutarate transaminase
VAAMPSATGRPAVREGDAGDTGEPGGRRPGATAGTFRGNRLAMAGARPPSPTTGATVSPSAPPRRAPGSSHACGPRPPSIPASATFAAEDSCPGPNSSTPMVPRPPRRPAHRAARRPAAAGRHAALDRGIVVGIVDIRDRDRVGSVIRLLPPLTLTEEQPEAVLDHPADALTAATAGRT